MGQISRVLPASLETLVGHAVVGSRRRVGPRFKEVRKSGPALLVPLASPLNITYENVNYFIEVNPNGEWGWLQTGVNLPIAEALADLLIMPKS